MNLIKITPLLKRRVKDMIVDLIPEYKYILINKRGLVTLKTKWWSFKKTTVNITDLFIDVLPKKLAESCKRKGYGDTYERLFSNDLYVMLQIKAYKKDFDITEYIWDKYNVLHREVPVITLIPNVFTLGVNNDYLPVLSPVSCFFIPGIEKLFRKVRQHESVESLVEKISKIQKKAIESFSRIVINIHVPQYA
jgi:hypothetical protein